MISVIIPVYNVEKYLDQCIKSVIDQSYTNFECILINDGSTDYSGEICEHWATQDKRIKVIHQKNQGVSEARNKGIEISQGEYIVFIDSDDWVEINYLNDLMVDDSSDYVVSGLINEHYNKTEIICPTEKQIISISAEDINNFAAIFDSFLLFGPVVKRYKRSIINQNNIRFNTNISYGEDLIFNFEYLNYCNLINVINIANYHYRKYETNTLSTKPINNYFEINYNQWNFLYKFFESRNMLISPITNILYNRLWYIICVSIFKTKDLSLNLKQSYLRLKKILSIPEIKYLSFCDNFQCSYWIKFAIKFRITLPFIIALYRK